MNRSLLLAISLLAVACSQPDFKVTQYHLRGEHMSRGPFGVYKGEAVYRFDHNLKRAERQQKLGHYYVFHWDHDMVDPEGDELVITFNYRQGATGRTPKVRTLRLAPDHKNLVEIAIIGSEYQQHGRVLAWQASISQGDLKIGSEQSFLWD